MPELRLRPARPRFAAALGLAVVVAALASDVAQAHSFLVRSSPQAGARLASAPKSLDLFFSEPFVGSSQRIELRRVGGTQLKLPAATASANRLAVHQPLSPGLHGVFVVSWRVLSDDGHISLGEFAFAVGAGGALPTLKTSGSATQWGQVFASWLVFVGLALGFGGLASERLIWRRFETVSAPIAGPPLATGLVVAAVGALGQLVLVAGNERGGGFSAGLSFSAIGDALGTRPGLLSLGTLLCLIAAGVLIPLRPLRPAALVPLVVAIVFDADRGHSGTSGRGFALVADVIHLAGAALWVGALAHLVIITARASDRGALLTAGVRRYSRLALPTVAVVLATGVVTAIPEFRSVGSVLTTNYGRTLLIKAAIVGLVLLVAATARRGLSSSGGSPRALLRRLTGGELALLVGVLVLVALLVNAAPPRSSTASAASALPQLGPPPLNGPALRLADLAGQLGVGIAATNSTLQFVIVPPSDQPKESVRMTAEAIEPSGRSIDLFPRPCDPACFTIRYQLKPGLTKIRAQVGSTVWQGGEANFTVQSPLPVEKPLLLERVTNTMNRLRTVQLVERVTSGPGSKTTPIPYTLTGKAFIQTEVFGNGAVDVRPIARSGGLTELAFAFPSSNIWYRIWIDQGFRLRRELILSPGHLIQRTFNYSRGRPSQTGGAPTSPATPSAIASPPPNAVVLGQEDGDLGVGLSARPAGQGRIELQTTILSPQGGGANGLNVRYRLSTQSGSSSATASLCGSGCYLAVLPVAGRPGSVLVQIRGGARPSSQVTFALPTSWPAPTADALLRKATRVFRGLHSLVIHERLASSPKDVVTTTYRLEAPDRLTYRIVGGPSAVLIGRRRWDRVPGSGWKLSAQTPISQPTPSWGPQPVDAHLLGSTRVAGHAAWLISFYDPETVGFFTLAVDQKTLRTLTLSLTAAAHFMHHRYKEFNAPFAIKPPR